MSVFTFNSKTTKVTSEDIIAINNQFGVEEKDATSLDQYTSLLAVFHDACEELESMDDFIPSVDYERFPRENVHRPDEKDNKLNAWAYKVTIKDHKPKEGRKLLEGHNVAVKDCVAVAGVPMLLGTDFIKDYVPKTDATLITRLLEAGAVIKGKSVCENMCHSATSHSAATGPVQNALAEGYSTGGSSSGSAALVMDPNEDITIGISFDNGGSSRLPGAWSGAVAIKPTFGLIPCTGSASNEATNDYPGVLTQDVLTNAMGLQAIAGSDGVDDRGFNSITTPYYDDLLASDQSLKGMKIGILKEGFEGPAIEERVKESCLKAIAKFEALGAVVEEVSIPFHSKGSLIWTGISKLGGYLTKTGAAIGRRGFVLHDLDEKLSEALHDQERWEKAYPSTKNIYYNGAYATKKFPTLYSKCQNLSLKLKLAYNKALEEYDILVLPTVPYVARSHAVVGPDAKPFDLLGKQLGLSANTCGFNQSGHPVLALPCGMLPIQEGPLADSGTKLPVSLQLVGKWWDEKTIYKAAYAWEQNNNWREM